MDELSSILDGIVASKPAPRTPTAPSLAPKVEAIPATEEHFTEECEHGFKVTPYMLSAIAVLPNRWFDEYTKKLGNGVCILEHYNSFFLAIDAKCRAYHQRHPHLTVKEVLKQFV